MVVELTTTPHRGAFCQFAFWWIYYYGNNKFTRKETGETHICVFTVLWLAKLPACQRKPNVRDFSCKYVQYFSFPSKLESYLTSLSKDFKFRHRFVYYIVKVTLAMKCLSEKTEFLTFPQNQHVETRFQQSAIYKKGIQIINVSSNKPDIFIYTIISWPELPLKIK